MRVVKVTPISLIDPVPVYDMEVPGTSNFKLAAGPYVHNSKDVHDGVVGAYTSLLQRRASWQSVAMDDQSDEDNKRAELGDRFDGGDRR